jgi:hypothetical protein
MSSTNDATDVAKSIADYLRSKHPVKTAESVAADTGCTVAAVKRWIYSDSAPSCACLFKLIQAYGPDILAAVLPPSSWIERARDEIKHETLMRNVAEAERMLADFHSGKGRT